MERAFGTSFAEVRVHRGQAASGLSRALSAKAFTLGSDIAFADGAFQPDTPRGRHLLAHELTHVVQQRAGVEGIQKYDESTEASTEGGQWLADVASLLGPAETVIRGIHAAVCLSGLERPMIDTTFSRWVPAVCGRKGASAFHSREFDAFGHCWVGCEGTRKCGRSVTAGTGTVREYYREMQRVLGTRPHDSFKQDLANQALGRRLAFTPGTCYSLCDGAHRTGALDLTAPVATCVDCSAPTFKTTTCP